MNASDARRLLLIAALTAGCSGGSPLADGGLDAEPDAAMDVRRDVGPLEPGRTAPGVPRVWIDTDLGVGELPLRDPDDGWALLHALQIYPERVVGVSLVYGNTENFDWQRDVADRFLGRYTRFRVPEEQHYIPVADGARGPEDFGRETDASRLLVRALAEAPLTVFALGRLTTIATVVRLHPESIPQIERIYIMGGRRGPTPDRPALDRYVPELGTERRRLPDTNFDDDFESVRVLLASPIPITVIPTELSEDHPIGRADLARLSAAGPGAQWTARQSRTWLDLFIGLGATGFWPFDLSVSLAYSAPEMVQCEELPARVTEGPDDSYRQVPGLKHYLEVSSTFTGERSVRYCYEPMDRAALHARMMDELAR